jgi:RTX calcium-binding nonapeptide repeat (4 copies)
VHGCPHWAPRHRSVVPRCQPWERSQHARRRLCASVLLVGGLALGVCSSAYAQASHAGWPAIGHHEGHPDNESGVLRGFDGVHNELLGGAGDDTIWAGNEGDVIWGDSHEGEQPTTQRDFLHGGPGDDWIYASHGYNVIWTGAGEDHVALVYGYGIVYCNGPGHKTLVMRYLPQNRPWRLVGCQDMTIVRYRA